MNTKIGHKGFISTPIELRFWSFVEQTDSCWNWTGSRSDGRYGDIHFNGRHVKAHRLSWSLFNGEIPSGLNVCHKCDNPKCVRPDHLFLGTQSDNLRDCVNKGRHKSVGSFGLNNGAFTKPESVRRGCSINTAKLTTEDIQEIRRLCSQGENFEKLATRYSVNPSTIARIIKRQSWTHL